MSQGNAEKSLHEQQIDNLISAHTELSNRLSKTEAELTQYKAFVADLAEGCERTRVNGQQAVKIVLDGDRYDRLLLMVLDGIILSTAPTRNPDVARSVS